MAAIESIAGIATASLRSCAQESSRQVSHVRENVYRFPASGQPREGLQDLGPRRMGSTDHRHICPRGVSAVLIETHTLIMAPSGNIMVDDRYLGGPRDVAVSETGPSALRRWSAWTRATRGHDCHMIAQSPACLGDLGADTFKGTIPVANCLLGLAIGVSSPRP